MVEVCSFVELVHCWVLIDQDFVFYLVRSEDCCLEVCGGCNAMCQINDIILSGFNCYCIVVCEVYISGGNWSSYPFYKYDIYVEFEDGTVLEVDLEEFYYYKVRGEGGYAIQCVYTDDCSLDVMVVVQNDDIVFVFEGYYFVSVVYGYDCYYFNFFVGSVQIFVVTDDSIHVWTKEIWDE